MCKHVQFSLQDMIVATDEKISCSIGLFNKQQKKEKKCSYIRSLQQIFVYIHGRYGVLEPGARIFISIIL